MGRGIEGTEASAILAVLLVGFSAGLDPRHGGGGSSRALEHNKWWFGRASLLGFLHPKMAIPYLEAGPYSSDVVAQIRVPFASVVFYSVGLSILSLWLRVSDLRAWAVVPMWLTPVIVAGGAHVVYRAKGIARRVTHRRAVDSNDGLEAELGTLWLMAAHLVFACVFFQFGIDTFLAQIVIFGLAATVLTLSAPTGHNILRWQQQIQGDGSARQLSLHRDRRARRNR